MNLSEAIYSLIKSSGATKIEALKAIKEAKGMVFSDQDFGEILIDKLKYKTNYEKQILSEYETR